MINIRCDRSIVDYPEDGQDDGRVVRAIRRVVRLMDDLSLFHEDDDSQLPLDRVLNSHVENQLELE